VSKKKSQSQKCGDANASATSADAYQKSVSEQLDVDESLVEVTVRCKGDPKARVMPDFKTVRDGLKEVVKEAPVKTPEEIIEQAKVIAEPESAADAGKRAASEAQLAGSTPAAISAAAGSAAAATALTNGVEPKVAALLAGNAVKDAGGTPEQQKAAAYDVCGCEPKMEKLFFATVGSSITVAISVPVTEVPAVRASVQDGVSNTVGVGTKDVKVGEATKKTTLRRQLQAGCDETSLTIGIQLPTSDLDSPEVKKLVADFKKAITDGHLMANVQAAAAQNGVLTACLKEQDPKLDEPVMQTAIEEKEVVVSDLDSDLVVQVKVKATSNEGVQKLIDTTTADNQAAFVNQLSDALKKLGMEVPSGGLSISERVVDTAAPTKAPTKLPTVTSAPPTKSPTVEPTSGGASPSGILRPTSTNSSSTQATRDALIWVCGVVAFFTAMLVVGLAVYGKNLANWPCCYWPCCCGAAARRRYKNEPVEWGDAEGKLQVCVSPVSSPKFCPPPRKQGCVSP